MACRFDLYESADTNANKVGNGIITGTFYKRHPAMGSATTVYANEVVTINVSPPRFLVMD
jgi:hypothetical protein